MVIKEGNLVNSDIILSSNSSFIVFSLNTKTKPGINFKFIKAEMFVDWVNNRLQNSHVVRLEITTRDANPPGYCSARTQARQVPMIGARSRMLSEISIKSQNNETNVHLSVV